MTNSYDINEIKNLIAEVGESIYLLEVAQGESPDFELGIPQQYKYDKKLEIIGYCSQERKSIFINGEYKSSQGDLVVYLLENQQGNIYSKIAKSNTVCVIRNQSYSIELNDTIYHQSKPILYKITLRSSQTNSQSSDQNQQYLKQNLSSKESIENAFDF